MMEKTWKDLNEDQKIKYKEYCDNKYGKTVVFCETGEPLYFDENINLRMSWVVIELLFGNLEPLF